MFSPSATFDLEHEHGGGLGCVLQNLQYTNVPSGRAVRAGTKLKGIIRLGTKSQIDASNKPFILTLWGRENIQCIGGINGETLLLTSTVIFSKSVEISDTRRTMGGKLSFEMEIPADAPSSRNFCAKQRVFEVAYELHLKRSHQSFQPRHVLVVGRGEEETTPAISSLHHMDPQSFEITPRVSLRPFSRRNGPSPGRILVAAKVFNTNLVVADTALIRLSVACRNLSTIPIKELKFSLVYCILAGSHNGNKRNNVNEKVVDGTWTVQSRPNLRLDSHPESEGGHQHGTDDDNYDIPTVEADMVESMTKACNQIALPFKPRRVQTTYDGIKFCCKLILRVEFVPLHGLAAATIQGLPKLEIPLKLSESTNPRISDPLEQPIIEPNQDEQEDIPIVAAVPIIEAENVTETR